MSRNRILSGICMILGLLALSGCTSAALIGQAQRLMLPRSENPVIAPGNRLLIQGIDGNLYTMDPAGRNRLALTTDADEQRQYMQPTWSPSGKTIAWTSIVSEGGEIENALVASSFDGIMRSELPLPYAPFYIHWAPDGNRLAYLSNWTPTATTSMALRLVEVLDAEANFDLKATTLAEGQPFYFSWAPDSRQLLTHIGDERVELQSVGGESEAVQSSTAGFPAPQWSASGDKWVFAVSEDDRQRLILTDSSGQEISELTDFDYRIAFTMNRPESQLAYVVTDNEIGMAALGPLYVVDLETMGTRELSDAPVLAFFWSPDGEKLAFLAAASIGGELELRWNVWDGSGVQTYDSVLPSRTFVQNYLTFFDQYAQSVSIWSPDSSAFTYAGRGSNDQFGIWVQRLGEGVAAQRVARGVMSFWSPN